MTPTTTPTHMTYMNTATTDMKTPCISRTRCFRRMLNPQSELNRDVIKTSRGETKTSRIIRTRSVSRMLKPRFERNRQVMQVYLDVLEKLHVTCLPTHDTLGGVIADRRLHLQTVGFMDVSVNSVTVFERDIPVLIRLLYSTCVQYNLDLSDIQNLELFMSFCV